MKNKNIDQKLIDSAMSYSKYIDLLTKLLEEKKTTGENHSEDMLGYAKMNLQRMKRLNKTTTLLPELKALVEKSNRKMIWLVITEGWCGDAAQNIPIFNAIANSSNHIELKLILRDENLVLMDDFLTNGGRSIPKLIALEKETLGVIGTWGPRPEKAQQMVNDFKQNPTVDYSEFVKEVQLWYAKNKTIATQEEIITLMHEWN